MMSRCDYFSEVDFIRNPGNKSGKTIQRPVKSSEEKAERNLKYRYKNKQQSYWRVESSRKNTAHERHHHLAVWSEAPQVPH